MARDGGTSPPGFDELLRVALRREADRYQPRVTPGAVRAALAGADRQAISRRWALAAIPVVVLALLAGILQLVPGPSRTVLLPSATPWSSGALTLSGPVSSAKPLTLASCAIAPQDARLAFAGWATPDLLGIPFPDPARGRPVYALVTADPAAWAGPDTSGTEPILHDRSSRLACIYSPATGHASVVAVHDDWRPPGMADGCPASPVNDFGGYREVGGPKAWLTLTAQAGARVAGRSLGSLLWFRLSPPARSGQTVTAWAQPLGPGDRSAGEVEAGPASTLTSPPANSRFYRVTVSFGEPGCWVVDLAVDGTVMGSAVLPIRAIGGIAGLPAATRPSAAP